MEGGGTGGCCCCCCCCPAQAAACHLASAAISHTLYQFSQACRVLDGTPARSAAPPYPTASLSESDTTDIDSAPPPEPQECKMETTTKTWGSQEVQRAPLHPATAPTSTSMKGQPGGCSGLALLSSCRPCALMTTWHPNSLPTLSLQAAGVCSDGTAHALLQCPAGYWQTHC
jgi:hypothetical protein